MALALLTKIFPPRLKRLLVGGDEIRIESTLKSSVLLERVRQTMEGFMEYSDGATGYTTGSFIHVSWGSSCFKRNGFSPMFHGRVQALDSGSVITGRFSGGYMDRAFMWIWAGGLVFISIILIWTLIFPLLCFMMLWLSEYIVILGVSRQEDREDAILQHLQKLCLPIDKEGL